MRRSFGARSSSPVRLSRRLARRAPTLLAPLGLSLLLAACGSSAAGNGGSTGSSAAAGQTGRGGTLHFARSLDADEGLDPTTAADNGSIFIIAQIFDQLYENEEGTNPQP